jgi:UDP-N-acetylmuramoyl-tripeptide--D-alanyl-D-alanine ligase
MKKALKFLLKHYLKLISLIVVMIHRPKIIVIAGSTNKSFYKEEISGMLRKKGLDVRSNIKSFNTDIGLPLAILSLPSGYGDYRAWLPLLLTAPLKIFEKNFPKVLVLELGVSDPGDMKFLLSIIQPNIAVITNITQRYIEGFSDMDELVEEYEYLSKKMKRDGKLIYNIDNPRVKDIALKTKAQAMSFGFSDDADWAIISSTKFNEKQEMTFKHNETESKEILDRPGSHYLYARIASIIINSS